MMESSPPFVLRSVSLNDVTTESINTQPQNYAVVGGQTYRIRRSHEEKSFTGIASPRVDSDPMTESLTISSLLAQLKQSEETIQQQKLQLDYQRDRVRELEGLLRQLNIEENIIQRPFLFQRNEINAPAPPFSVSTISPVITQGKSLLMLSREKSATSDETDVCSDTPVSTFQSIDSLTPKAYPGTVPENKDENIQTARHKLSSQIFFPDSLNNTLSSNASVNDNDSVFTRNTVITVKDNDDLGLLDDDVSACKDSSFSNNTLSVPVTTTASPDRGSLLQQRLSMSTTERRKVLSTVCSSRSKLSVKAKSHRVITKKPIVTPNTVITPSDEEKSNQSHFNHYLNEEENASSYYNSRQTGGDMDKSSLSLQSQSSFTTTTMTSNTAITTATTRCFWKTKQRQNPQDIYLFIAYDNPQMHKSIEQFINTSSSSSSSHQMHVMIETHESKEKAKFLFGEICFSGFFNELEGCMIDCNSLLRGSNVLVIHELIGVSGEMKHFQRRNKNDHPDIIELLLINKQKDTLQSSSSSSSIQHYPIVREDDVRQFFQGCNGRVDVILDPYHDSRSWYPYYEGSRKMAPQFRSKGIGYLRLGDDMSNYGTAFLSLDAGKTFLDNGATNIVNVNANNSSMNSLMLTRARGLSSDNMSETSSVATAATSSSTVKRKGVSKKGLTTTIRKLVNSSRENSVCQSSEDDEISSVLTGKSSKI